MSLKQEIETWVTALGHYDNQEFEEALQVFSRIPDTSKILFNCGVIHATLGEHGKAVQCYQKAIRLDQYLAVAYFQQGVSNFLVGDFEEALANFNDTLLYLRGNNMIDYSQLGMLFKLYSCEVLFNRGLCYIYLQQEEAGMQDLLFAVKEKVVEDHNVIDDAIRDKAQGYTVFSIPISIVYRPNAAKVKNLKTKDYLGKARLVAASDAANAFTGFAGSEIKNATVRSEPRDDRPLENLSFAAANLVKPGLSSKRQQSEPPLNRNVFPPTPPPESERALSGSSQGQISRGASVRNGNKQIPPRLNIDKALPSQRYEVREEQSKRLPTTRAASETRGPSRREGFGRMDPEMSHRRRASDVDESADLNSELYDMYRNSRGARSLKNRPQPNLIEEEEEASDDGFDANDFEMVPGKTSAPRPTPAAPAPTSRRGSSRRPEIRKVRVKVHAADDVRHMMIGVDIEFPEFQERIRDKFQLQRRFKLKVREDDMPDGDMITMGDHDDLEMALMSVKQNAKRDRSDMGKMEVWVHDV